MTTDYVKRHGLKPAMRAFSVNDTMINGAPEQGQNSLRHTCIYLTDAKSQVLEYSTRARQIVVWL